MSKNLRLLSKIALLLFISILFAGRAFSKPEEFMKIKQFDRWDVVSKTEKNKKICHAITVPYKSDVFAGEKGAATLAISYKGKRSFTFSIVPGIELKVPNGVEVILDGRGHGLYASKLNAVTYSVVQDIALLNKIIASAEFIKTRSHGRKGDLVDDFYSVSGLREAVLYMDSYCSEQ